jgi:hypothetical protein
VFERHQIEYTERINDHQSAESFRTEGSWFHGTEVDRLSLEAALKDKLISTEEAEEIKTLNRVPEKASEAPSCCQ